MNYDTYLKRAINTGVNNRFTNYFADSIKRIGITKLKNAFGKEYYLTIHDLNNKIYSKLIDFIKDFDKDFDDHFNVKNNMIIPFVTVAPINARTFVIISSKQYIPGKMESAFMDDKMDYNLYLYIFGKDSPKYIDMMDNIITNITTNSKDNIIYTVNSVNSEAGTDISCLNMSKRHLDSLLYSDGELDKIRDHLDGFFKGREFYIEKELTYKTGILMYGNPGTGKSSLVKAIATEYNRAIISISCSNIADIDFSRLTMMINNEDDEQYIVLFEDIDTLYLNREENNTTTEVSSSGKKSKVTTRNYNDIINKLLQFLDSNQSPSNVIFIATTNYVDRLDKALIRDGRFDLKIEIGELLERDIPRFLETFDLDPNLKDEIKTNYIKYTGIENPERYNQSTLQNVILNYIKTNQLLKQEEEVEKIEQKINTANIDSTDDKPKRRRTKTTSQEGAENG